MPERDWQRDWKLCQRATPGPWRAEVYAWRVMPYICEHARSADANFIAEAREALPYWLQRVRELERKWMAEAEEKIRLRYNLTQIEKENARLKAVAKAAKAYVRAKDDIWTGKYDLSAVPEGEMLPEEIRLRKTLAELGEDKDE